MITTERFSATEHTGVLKEWFSKREMPFNLEDLAETGFIAYDRGSPVAAAFLRRCEGSFAIFDGLITDPDADSSQRNQALDLITSAIIHEAKTLKLKAIMAWSQDYFTLMRAERHGFVQIPQTIIALDLSRGD